MLQKLEVIILEVCYTGIFEHTNEDMHTCSHMQDTDTQHTHNVHACLSACTYFDACQAPCVERYIHYRVMYNSRLHIAMHSVHVDVQAGHTLVFLYQ